MYVIVVITSPYRISDKSGQPVKDEVLLVKLNPKTLAGEERELYGHQLVFLNPNYRDNSTPTSIRDWLDLIYESIHNSEESVINQENAGIRRAAELIARENMTPEERALSKNKEAGKVTIAKEKQATVVEIAQNAIRAGLDNTLIATLTGLSIADVQQLR